MTKYAIGIFTRDPYSTKKIHLDRFISFMGINQQEHVYSYNIDYDYKPINENIKFMGTFPLLEFDSKEKALLCGEMTFATIGAYSQCLVEIINKEEVDKGSGWNYTYELKCIIL